MTTILLAEDNQFLLENMALDLEIQGYTVIPALNGAEALHYLETESHLPDIVVSDIAMPVMDGFQLWDHISSNLDWSHIPILFITAFSSKDSREVSRRLSVEDYIVKPFTMDELTIAIQKKLLT